MMERETGFEPATSTLARSHSTTELFPPAQLQKIAYHAGAVPSKRAERRLHRYELTRASPALAKGVGHNLEFRPPIPHHHPDDIKAARDATQTAAGQIVQRHSRDLPLLHCGDCRERSAEVVARAGLDLDKHQHTFVAGDDVNLT